MNANKKLEAEMITRRMAFWILGVGAASGLATAALTTSDAEAQTQGMERRQDRRDNRQDRRVDRRDNRQDRREDRRDNRQDRREDRRTTGQGGQGQNK
jgi:uncharacterized protein YlxW (UPF0749 family)